MTTKAARRLLLLYLAALTIALMYPGVLPFNRVDPRVLGMPFVVFWSAAWVALGAIALGLLEWAITRDERAAERRRPTRPTGMP